MYQIKSTYIWIRLDYPLPRHVKMRYNLFSPHFITPREVQTKACHATVLSPQVQILSYIKKNRDPTATASKYIAGSTFNIASVLMRLNILVFSVFSLLSFACATASPARLHCLLFLRFTRKTLRLPCCCHVMYEHMEFAGSVLWSCLSCTLFGFRHFCFVQFPSQLCCCKFLCIVFSSCCLLLGKAPAYESSTTGS